MRQLIVYIDKKAQATLSLYIKVEHRLRARVNMNFTQQPLICIDLSFFACGKERSPMEQIRAAISYRLADSFQANLDSFHTRMHWVAECVEWLHLRLGLCCYCASKQLVFQRVV